MHGKLVLVLFVSLFSFICVRFNTVRTSATNSSSVHNINTGLNYTSIQNAIEANETLDGHTIKVDSGMYPENLVVNKSIVLIGEDRETTTIDASHVGNVVNVTVSNVTITGFTISHSGSFQNSGIFLSNVSNCNVSGNNIRDNNSGVLILESSGDTVSQNHIANNTVDGISLQSSSTCTLSDNDVLNHTNGIYLSGSSNNSIRRNDLEGNTFGIHLTYSSNNNLISGNNMTRNSYDGLRLSGGPCYNTIIGNNVTANQRFGIWLRSSANYNNILENYVAFNNGVGIRIECSYNIIFHNSLLENHQQAFTDISHINMWDDGSPSGGNYWSNYNGVDANLDGLGDTAYTMDANNTDNCPLMGRFYDFVVNDGGEYHVQAICNGSVRDLQVSWWLSIPNQYLEYGQKYLILHVLGETDTTEFCRLTIPRTIIDSPYTVLVDWNPISANELVSSNGTHAYLYFTYQYTADEIIVIPEFSSLVLVSSFMISMLFVILVYRRKNTRTCN
jgi:parallel beta-helix repeat protein